MRAEVDAWAAKGLSFGPRQVESRLHYSNSPLFRGLMEQHARGCAAAGEGGGIAGGGCCRGVGHDADGQAVG